MHMADALLSPAVGLSMGAVAIGALAWSTRKVRQEDLQDKKLPVMAVTGAFVFAAQMINFTIPGTGSSGHIGGGILLAALLGGPAALLTISAVLIIQSLFFADGGLLALGSNIVNMGIVPGLLVYPLLFQPLVRKGMTAKRLGVASVLSVVTGLQLGAFLVVLQTQASGITQLPFGTFVMLMQPIHLAIGLVEGLVTGAVLAFVHGMRPELLHDALQSGADDVSVSERKGMTVRQVLLVLGLATVVVGGALSLYASSYPDGLEWSMERAAGTADLEAGGSLHEGVAAVQEHTAFLPDYGFADASEQSAPWGTSLSGLVGSLLTLALAGGAGWLITTRKRKQPKIG